MKPGETMVTAWMATLTNAGYGFDYLRPGFLGWVEDVWRDLTLCAPLQLSRSLDHLLSRRADPLFFFTLYHPLLRDLSCYTDAIDPKHPSYLPHSHEVVRPGPSCTSLGLWLRAALVCSTIDESTICLTSVRRDIGCHFS